ncbi:DNA topoisomerase 3 (plasmid) [Paenibacillus thiaminolyticus]|uniref:type IA DNA topoisomerase n=1 Tax=Paenibacillus thiaminolyticus TaxID=49283 RepID=UPI00232EF232|nr:type IA DNA topoisomerase [Paenibacillus thiaminolyticus]WCF11750.1 DNA topoisomerase 3 [Paenibacillus thiaminolyticus]
MKALLIAEKPSLMKDIREVYKNMSHPDDISFTALVGHVVELQSPDEYKKEWGKPWKLDVLPMIPDSFQYKKSKNSAEIYDNVRKELMSGKYDYVINACDAGREGELIFYAFYKTIGSKLPVKRLWASDTTEETMKEALLNMIDDKEPSLVRLRASSTYRAYFDWLMGMNLSRAITLKTNQLIPVGRVMTPTLAIVVNRELEIQNFKPKDFWEIEANFGSYKGIWFDEDTGERRIFDKPKAESIVDGLGKEGIVYSIDKQRKHNYAPTLHSLLELQKEAGKAFGYTADKVLSIAQVLYEKKKLLSYPRTESRYLPKNLAGKLPNHLRALEGIEEVQDVVKEILGNAKRMNEIMSSKKYVDDKKVTDHHAIIPTTVRADLSTLSTEEKNIYMLVVKRLLSIFMDPYVVDKTLLISKVDDEMFKSTGSTVINPGYMKLYQKAGKVKSEEEEDAILPPLKKGDKLEVQAVRLISKQTTPPSRYDDPGLLQAMANAGGFVDDEDLKNILKETAGLGTSATRAGTIEKLISRKMIGRKGKSLVATQFGIDIIKTLNGKDIISPELTAKWEIKLRQIEEGNCQPKEFYNEMLDYINEVTEDYSKNLTATVSNNKTDKESLGKCPKCSSEVYEGKSYYLCKKYKNPCDFIIGKEIGGAKLSKTEVKKLLAGKETKEMEVTYRSGSKRKTRLKLNADGKVVSTDQGSSKGFSGGGKERKEIGKCPKCSDKIVETKDYYLCKGYKQSCDFIQRKFFCGANITEEDMKNILSGNQTRLIEFTWNNGRRGNARMEWTDNKINLVFEGS